MTDTRLVALDDFRGPLDDLMGKLVGCEGRSLWLPAFKKFLRRENPWEQAQPSSSLIVPTPGAKTYPTTFIRGLSWRERIERWKKYDTDWIDPEIWECVDSFVEIQEEDASPIDVGLDHFGKSMSSSGVESSQAQNGKTMISPARFLSLCETYPDLQRNHPIVCTQKICVGRSGPGRVLYANESAGERGLCLFYHSNSWRGVCRFPYTRKLA